jgi:S1-C subfamily serine protease
VNILDGIILIAAIGYGIGGFRSGALVGIFSLIGFFGGAIVGAQLAKPLGSHLASGRAQIPVAIVCVLVVATLGQVLGVFIAGRLRSRFIRGRGRPLDSALGAVMGVVAVLLVAWMVAVPLAVSPYPSLASQASHSKIVRAVNGALPSGVRTLYSSLRGFLDRSGFPPVLGDLPSTPVISVAAPPSNLPRRVQREVTAARRSVLKIYAEAPECGRGMEGSGFVYAPQHVLTNAHVVAGAQSVTVGGKAAKVVVFDPDRDVAVLYVPGLRAPVLPLATHQADSGTPALVLGYPENGPYTVRSARVRSESTVRGSDIYGHGTIDRSIYSIRAIVRSGNSGGPLLAYNGSVYGIVFATALDSSDTGFVLTDDEVRGRAREGRARTSSVSTSRCTPEGG